MALFIKQEKPKDFDCGYNLDLMIQNLPKIEQVELRQQYAERIVEVIKQNHRNWVRPNGESPQSWDHFFDLADYNPQELGVKHPYGYPPAP